VLQIPPTGEHPFLIGNADWLDTENDRERELAVIGLGDYPAGSWDQVFLPKAILFRIRFSVMPASVALSTVSIARRDKDAEGRNRNKSRRGSRSQTPGEPVSKKNMDRHSRAGNTNGIRLLRCRHLRFPPTLTTIRGRQRSGSANGIACHRVYRMKELIAKSK
jgi:hypothetical protein